MDDQPENDLQEELDNYEEEEHLLPQKEIVAMPTTPQLGPEEKFGKEPDIGQSLLGTLGSIEDHYFPPELIGGCCPRVEGEEEAIVWNAAAEAADSERVHIVYSAKGDKIWYLAVRSADLNSHPNTWCPFAALLPGMKSAHTPPACYTYYTDESATIMTVLPDGLQIHRGTSSVVRAKAERTARALGNAPVIDLVPDKIEKLTPVVWQSISLLEERARRVLASLSVFSALVVMGFGLAIWFFAAMATISAHADLTETHAQTEYKTKELMKNVQNLHASPMREQLAKFADLNDGLLSINALLDVYQVKKGKTYWRAVIPPNITSNRITELGAQTLDSSPDGVIIGNSREALNFSSKRK